MKQSCCDDVIPHFVQPSRAACVILGCSEFREFADDKSKIKKLHRHLCRRTMGRVIPLNGMEYCIHSLVAHTHQIYCQLTSTTKQPEP